MMKRLSTPPLQPRVGALKTASGRVFARLVCAAVGALAVSATARALSRSDRPPSTETPPEGEEPDVLLEVRELEVDRLTLEVEDLRAHVSLMAELANLLRLSVGVDATLDRVKLEIQGVEANVLLKVRLEHVRAILEKALDTIAAQPEILRVLTEPVSELTRERLEGTQAVLAEVLEGLEVGGTVDEVLRGRLEEVRATLAEILERGQLVSGGEEPAPSAE